MRSGGGAVGLSSQGAPRPIEDESDKDGRLAAAGVADPNGKILPPDRLGQVCAEVRAEGRKIVLCHGVFETGGPHPARYARVVMSVDFTGPVRPAPGSRART